MVRQAVGVGDGDAGVDTDRLDVRHRAERGDDLGQAPRRQHQRVPAGQDDLGHGGVVGEPGVGSLQFGLGQQAAVGADMFAAEAEPAVNRADQQRFQQCSVRIPMHHALNGGQRIVADRIGALMGGCDQFGGVGDELPRDRVILLADQGPHRRRQSNGVSRLRGLDAGNVGRLYQAGRQQRRGIAQGQVFTSAQPSASIGWNALSIGIVASSLNWSHSPFDSPGVFVCHTRLAWMCLPSART